MRLCCDANVIVLLLEVNGVFTHNATSDIVDVECTLCHQYKKKKREKGSGDFEWFLYKQIAAPSIVRRRRLES